MEESRGLDIQPRGSVGVGGEHASHQGYCINTSLGMCTGIHLRAQSDRLHGDLCNIMNKLDKVELWSQQTWLRLNGRALVNNRIQRAVKRTNKNTTVISYLYVL